MRQLQPGSTHSRWFNPQLGHIHTSTPQQARIHALQTSRAPLSTYTSSPTTPSRHPQPQTPCRSSKRRPRSVPSSLPPTPTVVLTSPQSAHTHRKGDRARHRTRLQGARRPLCRPLQATLLTGDQVSRIKERVEEKEGIPPAQQRLIFGGKQM